MLLRNQECYLEVLEVDHDQVSHRFVLNTNEHNVKTKGFFFDHEATTYGLGARQGAIFFLLQQQLIQYGPEFKTEILEKEDFRVFTSRQGSVILARIIYTPAKPFWNFFTMDDEDVDGFMWIHNVLSSAERQAIFILNNDH